MRSIPFGRLRSLSRSCLRPANNLSPTRHYGRMKALLAQKALLIVSVLALAVCWALVILTAISVSEIVLNTLDSIVELAQL